MNKSTATLEKAGHFKMQLSYNPAITLSHIYPKY